MTAKSKIWTKYLVLFKIIINLINFYSVLYSKYICFTSRIELLYKKGDKLITKITPFAKNRRGVVTGQVKQLLSNIMGNKKENTIFNVFIRHLFKSV